MGIEGLTGSESSSYDALFTGDQTSVYDVYEELFECGLDEGHEVLRKSEISRAADSKSRLAGF